MTLALDIIAMLAAFASSVLWFQASGRTLRRVQRGELIDEHDLNRIVTAFNRNQILNGRAALATSVSAIAVAFRLLIHLSGYA
jgi:hypothetical protein